MKNIHEVISKLGNVVTGLESREIPPAIATEMSNASGKIISALKVELEYHALRKKQIVPKIDFLEAEK
ncbi:hypothetical protein ISG27_12590 [Burkholderia pseudomallei]|nr:hypothetical protein [Burkholderia pseudomallei]MBF3975007.1 hypothetical protein [Burkholderia pseudomallei]CAJ5557528.1 Uncharacterised protein [Burkholderia pseudomallei]CAJ7032743.1 Uncharacterised protein [Burkholderia pseudomallei]